MLRPSGTSVLPFKIKKASLALRIESRLEKTLVFLLLLFEAFFAFWQHENWRERNTFLHLPQFWRVQKAKNASNLWKALQKCFIRRLITIKRILRGSPIPLSKFQSRKNNEPIHGSRIIANILSRSRKNLKT